MDKIKATWNNLQQSERNIITWGGLALSVMLLYFYVWEPWHNAINQYKQTLPAKRADLQWMQSQAQLAGQLKGTAGPINQNRAPLLTIVERTAQQRGLRKNIKQMSPGDQPGEVRVWLSAVNFDLWLQWVEELKNKEGIEVQSANVQSTEPGLVEIRATYSRL